MRINLDTPHPEAGSECLTKVNLSPPRKPPNASLRAKCTTSLKMKASLCLIRGETVSPHFRRIRGKLKRKEHGPGFRSWNAECSLEWKGNDSPDLETTLICHESLLFPDSPRTVGVEAGALVGGQRGVCRERACRLCVGPPGGGGLSGKPREGAAAPRPPATSQAS